MKLYTQGKRWAKKLNEEYNKNPYFRKNLNISVAENVMTEDKEEYIMLILFDYSIDEIVGRTAWMNNPDDIETDGFLETLSAYLESVKE